MVLGWQQGHQAFEKNDVRSAIRSTRRQKALSFSPREAHSTYVCVLRPFENATLLLVISRWDIKTTNANTKHSSLKRISAFSFPLLLGIKSALPQKCIFAFK